MSNTTGRRAGPRKSRADRGAEQAAADQAQPEAEETEETTEAVEAAAGSVLGADTSEPEPEETPELPTAAGTLGAGRIVYHQPQLTLPSGEVIDCPHAQWGHAKPAAAVKCLRALAAANGVRVETPES